MAIGSRTTGQRRSIVIAGPNGAGKTTFAREFLPRDAGIVHFVNVDLIAGGLSPLRPDLAALAAGRLYLAELDRLSRAGLDFAFETTLSGLGACFTAQTLEVRGLSHRDHLPAIEQPAARRTPRRRSGSAGRP